MISFSCLLMGFLISYGCAMEGDVCIYTLDGLWESWLRGSGCMSVCIAYYFGLWSLFFFRLRDGLILGGSVDRSGGYTILWLK